MFAIVFFVVVTSTLIQGASFEPLAKRLGLTTDEPALPRRLLESGRIRRMGGDVIAYRLPPGAAAAGHPVRDLELPREALVNVIVRDGQRDPAARLDRAAGGRRAPHPRPRRAARGGRGADRDLDQGPDRQPPPPPLPRRAASQVFSVRPARERRRPARPDAGRRRRRWSRCCAAAATASARWRRSPTAATR